MLMLANVLKYWRLWGAEFVANLCRGAKGN